MRASVCEQYGPVRSRGSTVCARKRRKETVLETVLLVLSRSMRAYMQAHKPSRTKKGWQKVEVCWVTQVSTLAMETPTPSLVPPLPIPHITLSVTFPLKRPRGEGNRKLGGRIVFHLLIHLLAAVPLLLAQPTTNSATLSRLLCYHAATMMTSVSKDPFRRQWTSATVGH